MHHKNNSTLLAIFACVLWATAFAGIKIGLEYTTPLRFAGIRFMIAGLLIIPFVKKPLDALKKVRSLWKKLLIISLFQTFGLYLLFYLGIARVPAAVTALIVGAGPLVIAIMAHFAGINENFGWKKASAAILGVIGITIIAFSKNGEGGDKVVSLTGILLLIGSNLSGGFGNIIISKYKLPGSPLIKNAIQLFVGGMAIFIVSLFVEVQKLEFKPMPYYYSLAWLSFISAAAFSFWFIVLQRKSVKVSEINIWKFIIPVFGATLSWIVIPGEHPTIHSLLGVLFVGSALIIMNISAFLRRVKIM